MSSSSLALYRGPSIPQAKLVAVTADPGTVSDFAARLLDEGALPPTADPVLREVEHGRRSALRLVAGGAEADRDGR